MTTPSSPATRTEALGRRTGNRLSQLEEVVVLPLAEVIPAGQLLQADEAGSARSRLANAGDGVLEVGGRVGTDRLLDESHGDHA